MSQNAGEGGEIAAHRFAILAMRGKLAYLNGLCYKYSAIVITTDMWDRIDGSCGIKNSDTEVIGPD